MADILLETACLPLYSESTTQGKYVPERNSLNLWNASGRARHENEVGIPIPIDFRNRHGDFFPGVMQSFDLKLPNFRTLKAKQCQQDGKALMSNPNKDLGKWILRDVLNIPEGTLVTYSMLLSRDIDSVYVEKWSDGRNIYYKIFPAKVGEYDRYIRGSIINRKPISNTVVQPVKTSTSSTSSKKADNIVNNSSVTIKNGTIIVHPKFGKGVVVAVKDSVADVKFGNIKKSLNTKWLIEHNTVK